MSPESNRTCEDLESSLVKKITGELLPQEERSLATHLSQCTSCVAKQRDLTRVWQRFDSLQGAEIPKELYDKTRDTVLGHMRQEESPKKFPLLDLVPSFAIPITLLTLLISYLSSAVDPLRWLVMSAAHEVALGSNYLFGTGNTFVTSWWIYACLASFICAFVFGFHRGPALPRKAFLGSLLVTILLFPAIYLHGSSHGHGYGILAFAALGTFVGALIGTGLGSFIRRQIFSPAT